MARRTRRLSDRQHEPLLGGGGRGWRRPRSRNRKLYRPRWFCQRAHESRGGEGPPSRRGGSSPAEPQSPAGAPGDAGRRYLISTFAPCASRAALIFSASSRVTPSLTGFGDASTRSLASLRPRPVSSRTTLMTGILFGPISVRMAVNSVCSSATSTRRGSDRGGGRGDRGGRRDAEPRLELLDEVGDLDEGHRADLVEQLVLGERGHGIRLSLRGSPAVCERVCVISERD